MATPKADDADTDMEIGQNGYEALAEDSVDRTSNDWPGVGWRPLLKALGGRRNTVSRRTVLKTVGAGVVLGSAFTGEVAARDDTLAEQLSTVWSSTRKYRDVATARADGYEEFGVLPPVGHVFQKSDYFDGAEFIGPTGLTDPPSLLFYAPFERDGDADNPDLILAGVEYHVSGDHTSSPPNLFDDENSAEELEVTEQEGWHRSPMPDALDVTGLHVWVHLHNPEGVFQRGHPIMERLVGE